MKIIIALIFIFSSFIFAEMELASQRGYISRYVEIQKENHVKYDELMVFFDGKNYNWFDEYFTIKYRHYYLKNTVYGVHTNSYNKQLQILTLKEYIRITHRSTK